MGSDGVFDFLSNEEVKDFFKEFIHDSDYTDQLFHLTKNLLRKSI